MKTKIAMAFLLALALGFCSGAQYPRLQAYARGAPIAIQGERLLAKIQAYKDKNDSYPSQEWFGNLGDERVTIEKRLWTYHLPPIKSRFGDLILISAPIDRGNLYLYGYVDGHVSGSSFEILKDSESGPGE